MNEETKTDLEESVGARWKGGFKWGQYVATHSIDVYDIVEYYHPNRGDGYEEDASFHPFVDGKDTHHSWPTLDSAIAFVIAYRAEGPNSQAARYFCRMLNINTWED